MWEKVKTALNSSILWLVALIAAVAILWGKLRSTQDKLEENKADEKIKDEKEAVVHADDNATSAEQHFEDLSRLYKQQHPDD